MKGIEREETKFRGQGGPCLEVGERLEKERWEGNFGWKTHKEAFVDGGDEIALDKDANF